MSIVAKKIMMGSGAVALPSDDQFNRVSFLSHFDGANNGVNNAFDDGSASNHTITANGNVTQGSFGPFARPDGEWGVSFDGDDYLSVAETGADEFTFGTGNFTIEGWINNRVVGGSRALVTTAQGNDRTGIWFGINGSVFKLLYNDAAGNWSTIVSAGTPVTNVWTHFAIVRNGTSNVVYINGSSIGSTTETARNLTNSNNLLAIGGRLTATDYTISTMSNVRVVKGTAVYTGNFTPATSKLTAITNTKLLTCQSNRFVDNSASPLTITPVGNTAVTAFGPFLTSSVYDVAVNGASAYFDGSGDYITCSRNAGADYQFGSGNFTVESYFYVLGTANGITESPAIDLSLSGASSNSSFFLNINHNQVTGYFSDGSGWDQSTTISTSSNIGQWVHVAWVRNGSTLTIYRNGVSIGTITSFITLGDSTLDVSIGTQNSTGLEKWKGYMSDIRLVKGTAVYTSNFTPPTAPLTAVTNTKLLLNMADGQAIDSAAQNNLTLFGTAKTSTAQKKFGTASLLLDGNSDFAYLHNRNNLSGPFCIEAWGWADNLPSGGCTLWCLGTYKIELQVTNDTVRIYRVGTAEGYTNFFTGGEFSADTWHHVAIVRDTSNVIKCYLNGTASSTTVTDATAFLATSGIFIIGAEADGDPVNQNVLDPWDGYIDDFRISNFARYTSNFTAPTKPFADKGQ